MIPSAPTPSIWRLLSWATWLFWKSPANRRVLAALTVLTVAACICGHHAYSQRYAAISRLDETAAWNRKLQRSEFGEEVDLERIVGSKLSKAEEGKARIQRMIATLPTSLAYSGGNFNAVLPPSPLAVLATGASDLWPNRLRITAHSQRENLEREEIVSPEQLSTGFWDVSMVVVLVLPLAILALSFNLLADARSHGVLAMILSNPISGRQWTIVNLTIHWVCVVATVLVVAIPSALLTAGFGNALASVGPMLLWSLFVGLYGLFWISLALLLNSGNGSSLQNGLILTMCWIVIVVVVPAACSRYAAARQPVLSQVELVTMERSARETAEKNGRELTNAYYELHPEIHRPSREEDPYGQTRWDAIRLAVDSQIRPRILEQISQLTARLRICEWGMLFSPALATKAALDDLSGTSLRHHLDFVRHSCEFDEEFKAFFQPRMMSREKLTLADYDIMPEYRHRQLAMQRHDSLLGSSLLTMGTWSAVILAIGWSRMSQVSIRD